MENSSISMKTNVRRLGIYTAVYIMSFLLGEAGSPALSGLALIGAAAFLYHMEYRRSSEALNLRGLLALGLLGGEGIARFQLSRLSTDWTLETWLSFYLFYLIFDLTAEWVEDMHKSPSQKKSEICRAPSAQTDTFFKWSLSILLLLSWGAFFFEAWKLGFVPLFTHDMPHAYSCFHVKGVHYVTTLAVLIPSISMLYIEERRRHAKAPDLLSILGILLPLLLTVLMVSRFQFLFAVILAIFVTILSGRQYTWWQLLVLLILMISAYVFITIERAHSVEYLNSIFEMKNPTTPIFITQPYMYIANNYDNFNVMTQQLETHAHGLRMLYPFVTLTGLKFFIPALATGFPLYVTKAELTTVTMLYDAWYDFGLFGIVLFAFVLGLVVGCVSWAHQKEQNPFAKLLYAQLAFYFTVSFFTTWFSNPATWFYLGVSFILYLAYAFYRKKECKK